MSMRDLDGNIRSGRDLMRASTIPALYYDYELLLRQMLISTIPLKTQALPGSDAA